MMSVQEIKSELAKLNKSQRAALRAKFADRPLTYFRYSELTGITVFQFNDKVQHSVILGKRGRIAAHEITSLK